MKSLVIGLKNIMWGVNCCNNQRGHGNRTFFSSSFVLMLFISFINANSVHSRGDIHIWTSTQKWAQVGLDSTFLSYILMSLLRCMTVYSYTPPSPPEEKEALDHFATMFTMVDQKTFQEVFALHMPFLFDRILENQAILIIPQHFLANQLVSRIFADILLNFLMERIKFVSAIFWGQFRI